MIKIGRSKWHYFLLLATLGCQSKSENKLPTPQTSPPTFMTYSKNVGDSFRISLYLPAGAADTTRYPVVYVLDANVYVDIYAAVMKQYGEVGLLPPAIIVGVGYKTFALLDSLRQRDYTFPEGLAEYEMPVSGHADAFRKFIIQELVPLVNQRCHPDTSRAILTGHSLGGYCALFSLLQDLREQDKTFAGYIAASPSLHFNHNYLLKQFDELPDSLTASKKVYIGFGGAESADMRSATSMGLDTLYRNLPASLAKRNIQVKTATYSDLDHMDTQIPAFIKGLQWMLSENKE